MGEVDNLRELLTVLLDTESIHEMGLDFTFLWDEESRPPFSLGSVINLRPWPNLEYV